MSKTNLSNDNDPSAWLDDHGDYLFQFAVVRVSDRIIAEDLVQETFLAALKNASTFDGNSSIRTWLTAILKHKILDHYRYIYKSGKNKIDVEAGDIEDFIEKGSEKGRWKPERAPKNWSEQPDKSLSDREFMNVLKNCLKILPERIATVFKMSQLDEMETEVICKEMKISTTNYWVIMHRARTGLRHCLEIHWFKK